jgi:ribosomal protein L18
MAKLNRHERRERRHKRIRKKIFGTPFYITAKLKPLQINAESLV